MSQDGGIDAIGFSQLTGCFGEVSDLARVGHDRGDLSADQSQHPLALQTAGGFEDDQGRPPLLQLLDQTVDAGLIVWHRQRLSGGANSGIELGFTDINTDKDEGDFQDTSSMVITGWLQPNSALRNMRAWITLATVRAYGEQGWDDPCYKTVCYHRGAFGLSHPFRINHFHTHTLN